MNISELAQGKWEGILMQMGVAKEFLTGKHGPCPVCGGKDRYRFDNKEGKGTYYCEGCRPGDGFDLLMKLNNWDFKTAAKEVEKIVGVVDFKPLAKKKDPLPRLKRVSEKAQNLTGNDPASVYLYKRGLTKLPGEIRFNLSVDYFEDKVKSVHPAMLCVVKDVAGNNLTYHITHLTHDGDKASVKSVKKIMPPINPIAGGAIRLFGIGEHICLSEGVETAIAAHEATGLPSWATISAGGLESFKVPHGVKKITIFADNDESFTGQKAAYSLANRLKVRNKIIASVVIPIKAGNDFFDIWTEGNKENRSLESLSCLTN